MWFKVLGLVFCNRSWLPGSEYEFHECPTGYIVFFANEHCLPATTPLSNIYLQICYSARLPAFLPSSSIYRHHLLASSSSLIYRSHQPVSSTNLIYRFHQPASSTGLNNRHHLPVSSTGIIYRSQRIESKYTVNYALHLPSSATTLQVLNTPLAAATLNLSP